MEKDHVKQQSRGLKKAQGCFTKPAFPTIRNGYYLCALPEAISSTFAYDAKNREDTIPISAADLLSKTACIFSPKFLSHLAQKFKDFDKLCGEPLVDGFLSVHSCQEWALMITENTLHHYINSAKKPNFPFCGASATKTRTPRSPFITADATISQFDGPADSSPEPIPIKQIHLKGPDLKQAWRKNEDILDITKFERLLLGDWTPSKPGGAPVFHGTAMHLKDLRSQSVVDAMIGTNPTNVHRWPGKTQIYPNDKDFAGIFTSFSAARSFLWAVFKSEVIQDPPGSTPTTALQYQFRLRNQDYQGVILLQFDSCQPAPPNLSWYQIPAGQESAWIDVVDPWSKSLDFHNIWIGPLKAIHGKDTLTYPSVVHGKDIPSLHESLKGFPCKQALLWQTAWMSKEAALDLNKRISGIYAISWEMKEKETPAPEPKKLGKFATLTRKFGNQLKKVVSRRDLQERK
ncbi:hypothetical protein PT974_00328 [Cladobotryum mycophilum]|uniref:Uncharacterized protein n=1 Tax=Cladobotryum mycophilum TaxID=491253 RepID=A0ABR0T0J8_9HYPO